MSYDVISVGGGLAGSSLALSLAPKGIRVLVLEKEHRFRDRVRGEGILPWGVNEARELGIYDLLLQSCGHRVPYWTSHGWKKSSPRDLIATTPRGSHCLDFYHPAMQEALIAAAEDAGAEVRRRITVQSVEAGSRPRVIVEQNGRRETIEARLVVGADGRASKVREWAGFKPSRDPDRLAIAGVLLEGAKAPDDSIHVFRNSSEGEGALCFPLGGERLRTYFIYRKRGGRRSLSGHARIQQFIEGCLRLGVPKDWLEKAEPAGPLAEFDGADTWVDHPYREGVVLLGDSAASNDPAWGNGLSLTLCDVRVLRDKLFSDEDWNRAGHAYAAAHDEHYGAVRRVTRWRADLMYEIGPEAEARRARAFPLIEEDRTRVPDYIALGPKSPCDEAARRRYFGEQP